MSISCRQLRSRTVVPSQHVAVQAFGNRQRFSEPLHPGERTNECAGAVDASEMSEVDPLRVWAGHLETSSRVPDPTRSSRRERPWLPPFGTAGRP